MRRALCLLLILFASAAAAGAFQFEPISQQFAPTGRNASQVFRVTNTNEERIAVRVVVRPRRILPDGREVQGEPAPEFVVYPTQMLLDPGEQRSVRVRYGGESELATELAYRIIAEQVPVAMDAEQQTQGGSIRLTYRYEGSLYVTPPGVSARIEIVAVELVAKDGLPQLRVEIHNGGGRHALLQDARLALMTAPDIEPTTELVGDQLAGLIGENMLADSTRVFFVPAPEGFPDGPLYGELSYDAK